MIQINEYNPSWAQIYSQEASRISQALGADLLEIHHIGSTAIPKMPAKPVIDMMLVIEDIYQIDTLSQKLAALGYEKARRQIVPQVSYFTKRNDGEISYHLHMHEVGSPQIMRHINFKDYLTHHENEAKKYAELKLELAKRHQDDIMSYVFSKSKLVQEIDAKARKWEGRRQDYLPAYTGPMASEWNKQQLISASVANYNCHVTHFAQYIDQVELIRVPGYTIVNSGLPDDTFNLIIDADFTEQTVDPKIKELTEYFTSKNIPFSWWVGPTDKPADLDVHMEALGYQNMETNPNMYLDLDAWDGKIQEVHELEIVQAKDEKSMIDFASVLVNDAASFKQYFSWVASILNKDDPFEYYVGYVNGAPVARAVCVYFGQVVGLYWLSTDVNQRRKGYGRALHEFHLKRAKEKGYHIAVLQSSEQGYPLYKKLGYQNIGVYKDFHLIAAQRVS